MFLPNLNEYRELYENKIDYPIHITHFTTTPETIRVPLILKLPYNSKVKLKKEVNEYIEAGVSILPTILDITGDKYGLLNCLDGISLLRKNNKKVRTFSMNLVFEFLNKEKYKVYSYADERRTVFYFDEETKLKKAMETAIVNFGNHQLEDLKIRNMERVKEESFDPEDYVVKTRKMTDIMLKEKKSDNNQKLIRLLEEQLKSLGYMQ